MELEKCTELSGLVEKLTRSGKPKLDEEIVKKIKKICRLSNDYVKHVCHVLWTELKRDHSEIRLSAFQLVDEIFNRSHCFRELVLENFKVFLELTVEADSENPLPPPKAAAKTLKHLALDTIQKWNNKFGEAYKKLALGFNYLKECKKVDFENISSQSAGQRRHEEQLQIQRENRLREKSTAIYREMQEVGPDVTVTLTQMENCFNLLLPKSGDDDIDAGIKSNVPSAQVGEKAWSDVEDSENSDVDDEDNDEHDTDEEQRGDGTELDDDAKLTFASVTCDNNSADNDDEDEHEDAGKNLDNEKRLAAETACCSSSGDMDDGHANGGKELGRQKQFSSCDSDTIDIVKDGVHKGEAEGERLISNVEDGGKDIGDDRSVIKDSGHDTAAAVVGDHEEGSESLRQHGLHNYNYELSIEINPDKAKVVETVDNTDVIHAVDDLFHLLNSRLKPTVSNWVKVLTKCGVNQDKLKQAIDYKQAVEAAREKYCTLDIQRLTESPRKVTSADLESEDSDSDFEEVPEKEGYEEAVPSTSHCDVTPARRPVLPKKSASEPAHSLLLQRKRQALEELDSLDPTSYSATLQKLKQQLLANQSSPAGSKSSDSESHATSTTSAGVSSSQESSSSTKREAILAKAPRLSFDVDLVDWDNPNPSVATVFRHADLSRFWTSGDDQERLSNELLASARTRIMPFTGKFEPVQHTCRAPLMSGKLCPRRDRYKCPFHGVVVPRDEAGNPTKATDAGRLEKEMQEKEAERVPDWQDPQLLQDLQAATGIDLQVTSRKKGPGKGRGKKTKDSGLTNLKAKSNTARSRLEKKVFKRSAMKKVAEEANERDYRRHHGRFANQFHYALKG